MSTSLVLLTGLSVPGTCHFACCTLSLAECSTIRGRPNVATSRTCLYPWPVAKQPVESRPCFSLDSSEANLVGEIKSSRRDAGDDRSTSETTEATPQSARSNSNLGTARRQRAKGCPAASMKTNGSKALDQVHWSSDL